MCQLLTMSRDEISAEGMRERTMAGFESLVLGMMERTPVVWILEDLHWFDEASREILERLVASMERFRVMVLVTHRPDYQPSWKVRSAHTHLALRPLTRDEASSLLRDSAAGSICVTFFKREDGTVLTRDCPVGTDDARRPFTAPEVLRMAGAPPPPSPVTLGGCARRGPGGPQNSGWK